MPEDRALFCPPKLTPKRREAILTCISKRIPYKLTAHSNGIGEETLYRWLRTGVKDLEDDIDSELSRFVQEIKKIEVTKISEHLEAINSCQERWQAQAWILERVWWKHFSATAAIIDFNERLERIEKGGQDVEDLKRETKSLAEK